MKRGKAVVSWTEPDTWRQAAKAYAKEEGILTFPWLSWLVALGLVGGLITWEWTEADPTTRASIPKLITIIFILFGFFLGMGWLHVRLNRTSKTIVYDRGLVHGPLTKKRWIPWSQIDYFYVDQESVGDRSFRFLTWLRRGEDDEEFSVVPDDADLDVAVQCFKTNKVEQAEDGDTLQRPC